MALKRNMRKTRKIKKTIKTKKTKKTKKTRRHTRRRVMRGGNYERDFTSRTIDGTATKAANKIVVTVPGYGTMSGSAYIRLKEDLDRNGKHFYD
jgi:hypothetical protein